MKSLLSLTVLLASVTVSLSALVKAPNSNFELLILHNNDMHARFEQTSQLSGACTTADREAGKCYGGFPRVAHVVKEARKAAQSGEGPPVLYLNAGDTYTGTAWFTIYKWKIAAEFINALQPDAVSLGNHEFDNGVKGLTPFIENITSPVLCANLVLTEEPELARQKNLKNSVVLNVAGHKIGVIGYLTPDTKILAVQNNVEYIDEIVALKKEVKKLRDEGVDILIALGHSGYAKDLEIAKEVEGLDLVIGGHTNTFLWNGTVPDVEESQASYPTYVQQASGRRVPVVQAYAYTKYLGKLLLTFDANGEVIEAEGLPILLDVTVPQDSYVLSIIEKYRTDILLSTEEIVGSTSVILDNKCALAECNLGNLITDAMVYYYAINYKGEHWTDAPIATIQAGGIRTSIAHATMPTNITKGDLLGVMPFDGNLTTVTLNGTVLLLMLEHSVGNYESIDLPGEFLQFSGLKVVFNVSKPRGSRVVKAEARCWACDVPKYFKVEQKDIYKIILPEFVANGGDGYKMLEELIPDHLGYSELACTQYYISHRSPVYPEIEGRSLGNHEFDEAVAGVIPFIRNLTSPVLAANLILDYVPELEEETNLYKSIVIVKKGIKIGIIGYLTGETKFLAPKNLVEYEDEIPALKREVTKLKHQGVNILIALGHSGFIKDLEIAKYVDDLDLVIGGHSNTFLLNKNSTDEIPEKPQGPYPTQVEQASGRIVRVVQAYAYTKYLGKLYITFDSNGEIVKCDGAPILLNQKIPRDPELLAIVDKYRTNIDKINNVVVGSSTVTLHGEYCRLRECNIGDLITDAILNYTKYRGHDVDIAVVQGGRIRASIDRPQKPFEVTRGDWITVLPFSDSLAVLTMNGGILRKALEHSVEDWRTIDSPGQFLQFSGMQVVYDLAQPSGSRVVAAKAKCSNCNGKISNIKDHLEYKVITCNFLAEGGDGFSMFETLPREIFSYNEVDSILYHLNGTGSITQQEDGRLVIQNEDTVKEPAEAIMNRFMGSNGKMYSPKEIIYYIALVLVIQFRY